MSLTNYLKAIAKKNDLLFFSDGREGDERGMAVRPARVSLLSEYGRKIIVTFSVSISLSGHEVEDDSAFLLLVDVTKDVMKDQTAGGGFSQVSVGEWNALSQGKGFVTFTSSVVFEE